MSRFGLLLLAALLAAFVGPCGSTAAWAQDALQPVPALSARVTDLTATLAAGERDALEAELAALEKATGAQLAVLVVPTTAPEDIAQYAIRVYDQWQLGRKGIDDGAILLVAKDDRRVRIEVGRGLEGAIPDAAAMRIIREYVTPRFRAGDWYGGIHDAAGVLAGLVEGEPLPPPLVEEAPAPRMDEDFDRIVVPILVSWVVILLLSVLFGNLPAAPRAGLVGLGAGTVGWLMSGLLPLGVAIGLLGMFLTLFDRGGGAAGSGGWGGTGSSGWGGGGHDGGGFGSGGFGGGSYGGGGGGGFRGGGGRSAGGGASGSW